jgi:hypothetical protein
MKTVDELLERARQEIEVGETSLRAAAEDIAAAQAQGATQRRIASAVGKSAAWVNALLKWRRGGYQDVTAFGPQAKASRQRARRVQATKQKAKPATTSDPAEAAAERARAEKAKAEAEKAKAEAQKAKADAAKAKAKAEARKAKDQAKARARSFSDSFGAASQKLEACQRDRLVKLLGMLGSHHTGERANAAQFVEQHRAALGLTWDQLIIPAVADVMARAA